MPTAGRVRRTRSPNRRTGQKNMDALPNQSDVQFKLFLARLLEQPQSVWSEKQQIELDMARALSVEMLHLAERMRANAADLESCLVLLKYAKVLEFILSSLSARRDINPKTLRTIFRLADIKVHHGYPD
jgi:hypothetical protein